MSEHDRAGAARAGTGGPAEGHLLASFRSYPEAQELVDRMSDEGFPVEHVRIVGDGVRTVEQVTGRRSRGGAAAAGAANGAWFGLFVGLLFALFALGPLWWWVLVIATGIGAVFGAVFGFAEHASTGGRRDFSSVRQLEAQRYDVYVDSSQADRARPFDGAAVGTSWADGRPA